ncbi:Sli15p NDAI_0C05300 [Naumovozyma dairenensis CBS 421]|uniref:Inner centromere protein ARK-binding domain-containing protein n=1 Tax=Naumovozyma dairenensis (strain ATCC 10597 / BCRC 20456 / CBS 421 / NBRC 0211 / NRRL Y-12639) TaxID=1071378 RepID=G0W8S8_NAUDC|nr:hypothetical protein NDAI_0C05300 [Naumovozyma dairenensis CBS 421]CCD24189.1 hypothetical protein NDAI_0C05300 [Naumovozyma dairenensis CBS 421]
MDWALQAAKKKVQRPPGSSRSIVESLNTFNNIGSKHQSQINSILNKSNKWINDDIESLLITKRRDAIKKKENVMVSPEKTVGKMDIVFPQSNDNVQSIENNHEEATMTTQSNTRETHNSNINDSTTPKRNHGDFSGITPKSLHNIKDKVQAIGNNTLDKTQPDSTKIATVTNPDQESPWSPIKVDQKLRSSTTTTVIPNATENMSTKSRETAKEISLAAKFDSSQNTKHKAKTNNTKKQDLQTTNRAQRRSNMFIPLPNKDPLIVYPSNNHNNGSTKSSNNNTVSLLPSRIRPQRNQNMVKRVTQSPILRTSNSTTSTRTNESIFDRLSSLSTKSFEHKIASKQSTNHSHRKFSSSSIDVTGSPMKRTSPVMKPKLGMTPGSTIDNNLHETLKDIFSTKKSTLESPTNQRNNKINDIVNITVRHAKPIRNSLIPKIDNNVKNNTNIRHNNVSPNSNNLPMTKNERWNNNNKRKSLRRPILPTANMTSKTSERHNNHHDGLLDISNAPYGKIIEKAPNNNVPTNTADKKATKNVTKRDSLLLNTKKIKHDRLTKFQLLPSIESEKQDLKRKLEQRLSGVMRTQQEQKRRRIENQRKKSQLEDEFRRRTRHLTDFREAPILNDHSSAIPIPNNNNISGTNTNVGDNGKVDTTNILHDIDTIDHRIIIGAPASSNQNSSCRVDEHSRPSLPEIFSDSEQEDTVTLTDWAKSPYLQQTLLEQQNWDPRAIFGPIPPLHTDEVFKTSRLNKLKPGKLIPKKT